MGVDAEWVRFETKTDAAPARASLTKGAAFTTLGQVTHFGCAPKKQIESTSIVAAIPVGTVSQPETVQGTAALIRVTAAQPATFDAEKASGGRRQSSAGLSKTEVLLQAANRRAVVTAAPRYGNVQPHTIELAPTRARRPSTS